MAIYFPNKKINYKVPTFTLDVNQIALKDPNQWPPNMSGLAELEYNYFEVQSIELCVTPETGIEIAEGGNIADAGAKAYRRFQKSLLYKMRPDGTKWELVDDQPNELWTGIRQILFPSVNDNQLNRNQVRDITQMFYHCTASGWIDNSAFLTTDNNFHNHGDELNRAYGVQVMNPRQAWDTYRDSPGLYKPTTREIETLIGEQRAYFEKLEDEAQRLG